MGAVVKELRPPNFLVTSFQARAGCTNARNILSPKIKGGHKSCRQTKTTLGQTSLWPFRCVLHKLGDPRVLGRQSEWEPSLTHSRGLYDSGQFNQTCATFEWVFVTIPNWLQHWVITQRLVISVKYKSTKAILTSNVPIISKLCHRSLIVMARV